MLDNLIVVHEPHNPSTGICSIQNSTHFKFQNDWSMSQNQYLMI